MSDNDFYTVRGYKIIENRESKLSASLEDYIEMIYRNTVHTGYTRVGEIAKMLNVKPSSVSKTLIKLSDKSIVNYEKYGIIKLTEKGIKLGKYFLWRHDIILDFFKMILPNNEKEAFKEAELVEHILSCEAVEGIYKITNKLKG